ncbi:unnamed protein product [Angiostrongylus costaricensis]|uniref:Tubulin domain-containing protein n=1 Tax=Angiostrongylus costaricensis TaxID=334426 RepID=A0A0R3PE54_ANGCS|nr:unnamed protein product [Angiostrongylus costaricensis]
MTHSLGGGTGPGMGILLISKIREEYPDRIMNTFSVVPSPKVPDTKRATCEILFAVSSRLGLIRYLLPHIEVEHSYLRRFEPSSLCHNEWLHAYLNADLLKFAVKMVPSPRQHIFMPGFAPLTSRSNQQV